MDTLRRSIVTLLVALLIGPGTADAVLLDPTTLAKYVDPLPNPLSNVLSPSGTQSGADLYNVTITQFQQQLHRDLAPTTLWGYNGMFPGPTFDVQRGENIYVNWINNLVDGNGNPLHHILPVDTTIHGAHHGVPEARTVTHLHGGITDAYSDGYPEDWVAPAATGPEHSGHGGGTGNIFAANYPNNQRAATLWYHDHAIGITRLNVYAGMAGFYIVRDSEEAALNLPAGPYEVPLVIQDRSFHTDGRLFYPAGPGDTGQDDHSSHGLTHDHSSSSGTLAAHLSGLPDDFPSDASIVPHAFGNTNLVNGVIWPFMEVEPRKYRFRILNGSNGRNYRLVLDGGAAGTIPIHQIGTEGGLLPQTVSRNDVWLAPADRADVIVDFSQFNVGDELLLRNTGPDTPLTNPRFPFSPANADTTGQVMKFKVVGLNGTDTSSLPSQLSTIDGLKASDSVRTRRMTLNQTTDEWGRPEFLLNNKRWDDPITETMRLGETEIWEFVNATSLAHPMHIHAAHFQILSRTGVPTLPGYELGFEDTVNVHSGETVRVLVRFDQFDGRFVWHCHMLEHEDYDMMRPMLIVQVPEPATAAVLVGLLVVAAGRRRRR
jgi:spore coat protein A